uniref:Cystatin domain-containing protein n=1 Tax=Tetraodon nigroviridis TaxID=99883 RepID=H3C392_TETNG
PGAPVNISTDDAGLQQAVLNATYLYNNQSNDAFLFKPSAVVRAHGSLFQIVKGFKYLVDFQISRTVCRKRDAHADLSRCDFQPKGLLHQTIQCHFEVWLIPWENEAEQVLSCK